MITMDEYTETDTSGRTRKWILQGGTAGGLILVGSILLASFSPIGAMGSMGEGHEMGDGHDMGGMGSMGEGHDMRGMRGGFDMGDMRGERKGSAPSRSGNSGGRDFGGQVAETLGMDRAELREAVRGSGSLAELAGDRSDELVADLVGLVREKVAQAVAEGRLTPERADKILADAEERVMARVNGERPERQGQRGRQGLRGGQRGLGS
ncbi:MAG: hypothetical protein HOB67_03720 [Acidimicrobiaceae bacterium]|nr:hypothetical protein [Acidimicrobiaceae bacterium]